MSRFPRSSLFYFALVVVLGLIFWFTWTSIQNGQNAGEWSYTQLLDKSDAGQVTDLEINGTDGVATEAGNHNKHNVTLQDCSTGCTDLLRCADALERPKEVDEGGLSRGGCRLAESGGEGGGLLPERGEELVLTRQLFLEAPDRLAIALESGLELRDRGVV